MTTSISRARPTMENLNSVSTLSEALSNLGYPTISTDEQRNSLSSVIEVNGHRYPVLIDINDEGTDARIEVKIANAGDLPDEPQSLAAACMGLLSLNAQIAPFAVAVYPTDHEGVEDADGAPITLLHSVPLGDLSTGELESAMMSCRRAILLVTQNISALVPARCGAGCGCHGTAASVSPRAVANAR